MNEPSKIQALSHSEVRERLLGKRHDGIVGNASPSKASKPGPEKPPKEQPPRQGAPTQKICAYTKCAIKFTPRRPDQMYHSPDCRKRAWFDRNFTPIPKPPATP
jgi:hypothetical protein